MPSAISQNMEAYVHNKGLGRVVQGHVLDCNKQWIERALKQYDDQLYLKWNPYKTLDANGKATIVPPEGEYWQGFGAGCWELRRRPNSKTAVPKWELGDCILFDLDYVETDVENHIKDFPYLNYSILGWVKSNDCWAVKDWVSDLEYREDESYNRELDRNQSDLKYHIKHERRAMRDFQNELKSGKNPLQFLGGCW